MVKKIRRGSSLVETALSIGLMGMLMVGFAVKQGEMARMETDNLTADRLKEVQGWTVRFLDNMAGQLANGIPPGTVIAIPLMADGPGAGGIPSFQEMGLVPEGYRDGNAFGHRHVILVRHSSPGSLTALVVQTGGRPVSDVSLGHIMIHTGITGGARFTKPPPGQSGGDSVIFGTGGNWTLDSSQWTANGISVEKGHAVARASVMIPIRAAPPPVQENAAPPAVSENFRMEIH